MVSTSPLQLVVTRVLGPVRRLTAADAAFRPQLRRADVVQHVPQKPDTVNVPRTLLGNRLPHRRRLEVGLPCVGAVGYAPRRHQSRIARTRHSYHPTAVRLPPRRIHRDVRPCHADHRWS